MVTTEVQKKRKEAASLNYLKGRLASFGYAWAGVRSFFVTEKNAQLHFLATLAIVFLSICYGVDRYEVIALTLTIAAVWSTEMINTAIEKSIDFVSTDHDPRIKMIKDVAAGAVLTSAIAAAIVGAVIFLPKIF